VTERVLVVELEFLRSFGALICFPDTGFVFAGVLIVPIIVIVW